MLSNESSFPRTERLRTEKEFQEVYRGKRVFGRRFIVYYVQSDAILLRKAGFAVSKKVSKLAVRRNKLKRRLREIYRLNKSLLPRNVMFIIRALPEANNVDFCQLETEIVDIFSSIASVKRSNRAN